jgi:hypothetical protein
MATKRKAPAKPDGEPVIAIDENGKEHKAVLVEMRDFGLGLAIVHVGGEMVLADKSLGTGGWRWRPDE